MSDTNGRFDMRPVWVSVGLVLVQGMILGGIFYATLTDHSRRLDLIEKRADERTVAREEYERRHEDMQKQIQELRQTMLDMERKLK